MRYMSVQQAAFVRAEPRRCIRVQQFTTGSDRSTQRLCPISRVTQASTALLAPTLLVEQGLVRLASTVLLGAVLRHRTLALQDIPALLVQTSLLLACLGKHARHNPLHQTAQVCALLVITASLGLRLSSAAAATSVHPAPLSYLDRRLQRPGKARDTFHMRHCRARQDRIAPLLQLLFRPAPRVTFVTFGVSLAQAWPALLATIALKVRLRRFSAKWVICVRHRL